MKLNKLMLVCLLPLTAFALTACGKKKTTTKKETTTIKSQNDLKKRVVELSNNVNKLPSVSELLNGGNLNLGTKMIKDYSDKEVIEDYTNPSNEYIETDSYYNMHARKFSNAEETKSRTIQYKNEALSIVKEFDKWIKDGNSYYYVSYDKNMDEVNIKYSDQYQVIDIVSNYDANGNSVIKVGYYYNVDDADKQYSSLIYIENEKWDYAYLVDCTWEDLKLHDYEYELIECNLKTNEFTELTVYETTDEINYPGETHYSVYPEVQFIDDDLKYLIGNKSFEKNSVLVFDKDGKVLFEYYYRDDYSDEKYNFITIPLYQLNGVEKAFKIMNDLDCEELIIYANDLVIDDENYIDEIGVRGMTNALGGFSEPNLSIYYFGDADVFETVANVLKYYNLAFKSNDYINIKGYVNDFENILSTRSAMGINDFNTVNFSTGYEAFKRNSFLRYTMDEALSLVKDPININNQKASSDVFNYIDYEFNGYATLEDTKIDFSNIEISVNASSLLTKDTTYVGKIILKSNEKSEIIKDGIKATFDGLNNLVLKFDNDMIDLKDYATDGRFYLFFTFGVDGQDFSRASSLEAIKVNSESKVIKLSESEDLIEYLNIEVENNVPSFEYSCEVIEHEEIAIPEEPTEETESVEE